MPTLTKKQKAIYDYIKIHTEKNGYAPTFEEIKKRFKLKALSGVYQHVDALIKKGFLVKNNNSARGIEIKKTFQNLIKIPLKGTIAAGAPIDVAEEEKEVIAVPRTSLPSAGDFYALRVVGDSMIDENINDGDIILVKHQNTAHNGQKVVALIDNHEATLKKFYQEKNHIRLQPANENIEPIILEKDTPLAIQGIFIDIIKKDKQTEEKEEAAKEEKPKQQTIEYRKIKIASKYDKKADVVLFHGDRLNFMQSLPDKSIKLVITSPPYNIGKEYEKRKELDEYLSEQEQTIKESIRTLTDDGSICWQVGNHIGKDGEVFPLDALIYQIGKKLGLKLRNRIIWHFGHGLHCSKRFSGRHETILWFTKTDDYTFNLDPVRVPQKYPGKRYFKGNKRGELSGNPLGKNPADVWDIPNVKNNHPEKTGHPCQFPIELIERLVLSMTDKNDIVFDPYAGVGSALCAAVINERKAYGSDIMKEYLDIAKERVKLAANGTLKRRAMGTPVYQPTNKIKLAEMPEEFLKAKDTLFGPGR